MNKISVYILLGILVVFCLGAAVVVQFDIQPIHGWIDNTLIEGQIE
jgi:hypothetical protein